MISLDALVREPTRAKTLSRAERVEVRAATASLNLLVADEPVQEEADEIIGPVEAAALLGVKRRTLEVMQDERCGRVSRGRYSTLMIKSRRQFDQVKGPKS